MNSYACAGTQKFETYYRQLSVNGVPKRTSLDPTEIPHLLPYLIIGEVESPEILRYRLVGAHVRERAGRNLTGQNFYEFVTPGIADKWRDLISRSDSKTPLGVHAMFRLSVESGLQIVGENLVLPFLDETGFPRFYVGYCEITEGVGIGQEQLKSSEALSWTEIDATNMRVIETTLEAVV